MCFSYVPSSQRKRFADLKNRAIFQNRVNGPLDRKTVRAVVGERLRQVLTVQGRGPVSRHTSSQSGLGFAVVGDTNLNEAPLRIRMPAIAGSMRGTTGRHRETPRDANRNTVGK